MSTDDQSTPTPMAVERRHVLMPAAALADLLGDVPCAVETQRQLGSRLRNHL